MAKIEVELADGRKAGDSLKELNKEAAKLRKEVAGLSKGTKEFTDAAKRLNEVEGEIKDIKEEIKSTVSASETLKQAWNNLPGAEHINKIADSFGMVKKGVGGLVSEFGILRSAIAATGIGALVLLLGALFSWFTTTQEGADKLTSVTRPLSAVFQALKGVLQELGGKIFKTLSDAVKNPTQALKDLGQVLLDNVINRFKAFALIGPAIAKILKGEFKEGFKDLGNAALQVATGVENVIDKVADIGKEIAKVVDEAYRKGQRIDELMKQIERAELAMIVRSKLIDLALKQQKDIVEDVTKSWDQRRQAAQLALQLQQRALNLELDLLNKRIEKMKLEQSLNDTSREQQKELAELEARKLELQAQATEQSIEWKKKIIEFDRAQAAEQLAIIQNLQDLRLAAMNEGMAKEIAAIELETQRKIAALTGSEKQITEQRKLLQEITEKQIQEVKDRFAKEEEEKRKARIEKELNDIEHATRDEELLLLERLANRNITAAEYEEELYQLQVQNLERQMVLLEQEKEQKSDAYQEIYAELLRLNIDHNNKIKQGEAERVSATISAANELAGALSESYQADIDAQQARVDRIGELQGEESEEYKKALDDLTRIKRENGNKQKRAEKTQVALNLITEVSSIWQGAATLGPIAGPIVGAILTAAALVRSRAALKQIDSQQFAKGGPINGPSHAGGGVSFTVDGQAGFEAEGGEVIINKRSAARFRHQLSAINSFGGWGRRFDTGGPVSPWSDQSRGPMPFATVTSFSAAGGNQSNTDALLRELIQETRATRQDLAEYKKSNDARIDRIQVSNNLQDTQEGLDTLNRIRSEADV